MILSPGALARMFVLGLLLPFAASATPTLTVGNASVTEGNSGTTTMQFPVTLSAKSSTPVTFVYSTGFGTATCGFDYVCVGGEAQVTIPANTLTVQVPVTVSGDTVAEGSEYFVMDVWNVQGATLGTTGDIIGTILDDDALPQLRVSDVSFGEGNNGSTSAWVTVSLSAPAQSVVSFDIATANGTAVVGSDYTALNLTHMQIQPGETAINFSVSGVPDTAVEPDETFTVNVSNVNGAAVADGSGTVTIVNDDGTTAPILSIADTSVEEKDVTTTMNFQVTLSKPSATDVTFDAYTLDDSAIAGQDYTAKSVTGLRIPAGQTSMSFSVDVTGDLLNESQERMVVNLAHASGATIGKGQAIGDINDHDQSNNVYFNISPVSIAEGQSGSKTATFTVSLTGAPNSTVEYDIRTYGGTATMGEDFAGWSLQRESFAPGQTSKTYTVTVFGDTKVESDESFGLSIGNIEGASGVNNTGGGIIVNDDSDGVPDLQIDDPSVWEGNSGTRLLTYTIRLAAAASTPVTFQVYAMDGSATVDDGDYVGGGVDVTIPVGSTAASFNVTIKGDTKPEMDESVVAKVTNLVGAKPVKVEGYGRILDDDNGVQIQVNGASANEGNSGAKTLYAMVTLSHPFPTAVHFDLGTADGSATAGIDYVAKSYTNQVFNPGETSKSFAFTINGDTVVEDNEDFRLLLTNVTGATVNVGEAQAFILNDDDPPPTPILWMDDISVAEGNSGTTQATFTATLNFAVSSPVTFTIDTQDGSAKAGTDYVAAHLANLTIPAGQLSKTFTINVNGDTDIESDEYFRVAPSNVVNAVSPQFYATANIINDDGAQVPAIGVGGGFYFEGSSGDRVMSFSIGTDQPNANPITFDITTMDGTATAPSDYQARSTTITIPAMQRTASFDVVVNGDTTFEQDEYFSAKISNVVGATVVNDTATMTIGNDDTTTDPVISILSMGQDEGNSGTSKTTFTVQLSKPATVPVTFDIATSDDTAVAGSDYVARSLTGVTIPVGQSSYDFDVTVNGDTLVEADENYWVKVSNASGAQIGNSNAQGTIYNDDTGGGGSGATLSIGDVTITEGNSGTKTANFTISLAAAQAGPVTVNVTTVNGTATAGSDYVGKSQNGLRIPAGTTSKVFAVTINGDTVTEPDETFTVNLSSPTGATIQVGQATGTIVNDDAVGTPSITIDDASVTEGNATQGPDMVFTLHLSAPSSQTVQVDAQVQGASATLGSDFTVPANTTVAFPPGSTTATLTLGVIGDTTVESTETVMVNLSNPSNATIGDTQAVGTIFDDDFTTPPDLTIGDVSITEGNSGTKTATFTISLSKTSSSPVTFDVGTMDGTAKAPTDYVALTLNGLSIPAGQTTKTVSVTINGDTTVEPDENFILNVYNVLGANSLDGTATGTILNDEGVATPSLSIGDVSIAEGNSGTKTATFTVSLSAAASSTVSFDVATANGTATAGSDFVALSLTGQAIAAGQTSKTVSVTINGDTTVEPDETFNVNVSNVAGASVSDGSALGTITNDDSAGGPTLSIGDVSIAEGNSLTKTATFTITLSAAQSGPVTVNVATADGTATAGSDYVAKSQTGLRIPAGSTSKTFAVTINGDTTAEPDETFTVNLSSPSAGVAIADGQAVGTITNDDAAATPTLSIADASVSEGNSGTKTLTFTVSLSPAAAGTVSYDIATSNGTATAGSDYVASTLAGQQLTAGQTSKTFVVTINGDTTTEADETFNVTLSNVSGATLGDGAAVGTITNDDGGGSGPTLSIGDVSIAEGNSLSKQLTFTVSLSAPASTAVTYSIATADGTAVAPTDYTAKSLTGQSIPAGTTSKTFAVAIKGDRTVEPNETFVVNVTGVTGATVADGQATGTITNDDAAALTVARFDAKGLVDDVDDGNHQPQVAPSEYALLLADSANAMCRRAPSATVIAVEGVEHKQVLADLAEAANAVCAGAPKYEAVMADADSRGFLIATPAKGELGTTVLAAPEVNADAKTTAVQLLGAGHAQPLTLVLADGSNRALVTQLQQRAKARPDEALVLLGANTANGLVDLTAREFAKAKTPSPVEHVLVNSILLKLYKPGLELAPLPANEAPAQVLKLQ